MPEQTIYSPEVRDIITYRPAWIVRNGIWLFLLVVMAIVASTFFIKYPDLVIANAHLKSVNAPKAIAPNTTALLDKLLVKNGEVVEKGQTIAYLESTANLGQVVKLLAVLDAVSTQFSQGNIAQGLLVYEQFIKEHPRLELGEGQMQYQNFQKGYVEFKSYLKNGFYERKSKMLYGDLMYLKKLHTNLFEQKGLQSQDLKLQEQNFAANESLNKDKVVADMDFRNEKSKLIGKKMTVPQLNASIIGNEAAQHEKLKEIAQLDNEIALQKTIFLQTVQVMKSTLAEMARKYVLIAPISGKTVFIGFLEEKQKLQQGSDLMYIEPGNASYFVEANIPQLNFGKVETGQKVWLKFPAYPYQEFGLVEGRLQNVSSIPNDSGFLAKIVLPRGLQTNFQQKLVYKEGLKALAEIETNPLQLSDRIFGSLRGVLKR